MSHQRKPSRAFRPGVLALEKICLLDASQPISPPDGPPVETPTVPPDPQPSDPSAVSDDSDPSDSIDWSNFQYEPDSAESEAESDNPQTMNQQPPTPPPPPVTTPPPAFPPTLYGPITPGVPPNAQQLLNDPTVQAAIDKSWRESQINPDGSVHEEGGWIYMNPTTGVITVVPTPDGPTVPYGQDGSTNHGNPPVVPGSVVVGIYHTHPYNAFPSGYDPDKPILGGGDAGTTPITGVPSLIIHKTGYTSYGLPTRRGGLGGNPGYPAQ